jgi:hypothetical protein
MLASCSGANSGSALPNGSAQTTAKRTHHKDGSYQAISLTPAWNAPQSRAGQGLNLNPAGLSPMAQRGGYEGSMFLGTDIPEWAPKPNKSNNGPNCTVPVPAGAINGIASDQKGNLIVPEAVDNTHSIITVYQGPPICGGQLGGTITDTTGQAVDAAAFNAGTGNIYVSEINFSTGTGDVVICTLASGACGAPITNSSITGIGAGVAIDRSGDCWLSASTSYNVFTGPVGFVLVYWPGCSGQGEVASGTSNASLGGLFMDDQGNLGSFDAYNSMLYVYSGCNPACSQVGSTPMKGFSFFGNLNGSGGKLAVGDWTNGTIDVYNYILPTAMYRYSFNNGLTATDRVASGIFSPTNQRI